MKSNILEKNIFNLKVTRLMFLLGRIKQSPLDFLIKKAHIEFKKIYIYILFFLNRKGAYQLGVRASFCRCMDLNKKQGSNKIQSLYSRNRACTDSIKYGMYKCLGFGDVNISPSNNWLKDDIHDVEWDLTYFAIIDFVKPNTRCDIKIVWEKNRLQFLVDLALSFQMDNKNVEDVRLGVALIVSWEKANPLGYGPNWVASMEVAIRAINIYLFYCFTFEVLKDKDRTLIKKILSQHLWYIEKFPEISDVQGNHYLFTMLGWLWLKGARQDNSTNDKIIIVSKFAESVVEQFDQNGMHVEKCLPYHRYCLDAVLLGMIMVKNMELENSEDYQKLHRVLEKGEAVCASLSIDGVLPDFGDNDSGQVINFYQPSKRFDHISFFLGKREKITNAYLSDYCNFLEILNDGIIDSKFKTDEVNYIAPYYHLKYKKLSIIIRAGELGLQGRASHDHDDNISYNLYYKDRPVIVEAGCGTYSITKQERSRILASSSHNTISIDSKDRITSKTGSVLASIAGAPIAKLLNSSKDQVTLSLDCSQLFPMLKHDRKIEIDSEKSVNIQDKVYLATSSQMLFSYLHFHPSIELQIASNKLCALFRAGIKIAELTLECDIADLILRKEEFLYGLEYGEYQKAYKLVICSNIQNDVSKLVLNLNLLMVGGN